MGKKAPKGREIRFREEQRRRSITDEFKKGRRKMAKNYTIEFGMDGVPRAFLEELRATGSLTSLIERARCERDQAVAESAQLRKILEQLGQSACPTAIVAAVSADRVTLRMGPTTITAAKPTETPCAVGDFVRLVQPSNQIIGPADAPLVGATAKVVDVRGGICDVSINGQTRSLVVADRISDIRPGESVVVDDSGHIALDRCGDPVDALEFGEDTGITWADVGGLDAAKEAIREAIEYPIHDADLYAAYSQRPSRGVLLYGPPGCGKTLLGKATASAVRDAAGDARGSFLYVKGPELLNKYVGATEEAIRQLFAKAREHHRRTGRRSVLFIDEADALLGRRGSRTLGGMEATVVPTFLAEMDGLSESGAFVLLSTNRPDSLDPAIVRDGRIDRKVHVSRPGRDEAADILRLHLAGRPSQCDPEDLATVALDEVFSDLTVVQEIGRIRDRQISIRLRDVVSGAVLHGIVRRATDIAIRRDRAAESLPTGIGAGDVRRAVSESARELRDTDLTEDAWDVMVREVGEEAARMWATHGDEQSKRAEDLN